MSPLLRNRLISPATLMTLLLLPALTSCELGDVVSRYQTVTLAPTHIATFTQYQGRDCRLIINEVRDSVPPPPLFSGHDQAGVGVAGPFQVTRPAGSHLDKMQTAVKFDLVSTGIPRESANELMLATLQFYAQPTDRSLGRRGCQPIGRVEEIAEAWNSSSDTDRMLRTAAIRPVPCSREGALFRCDVTRAVVRWLADPVDNPANGLMITSAQDFPDVCSSSLGEPGDRFECAVELGGLSLEIQYLPPDED